MDNKIYLYLGQENLLISNKIDRIVKESKADEYNISTYDLDEVNLSDAIRNALTPPFLNDIKVVIIKNPKFLSSEKALTQLEKHDFLNYIENPMETTHLIINGYNIKLDERKDVVKKLKKVAYVNESKELTEIEINGWVKRQCSLNNVEIKDDAIKSFYNSVGKNLLNAKNELDKLISYVDTGGVITTDVVKEVVVKEIQNDVFALSNAIIEQNKAKIINLYRDLTTVGNDINYLFSLVSKSMRETLFVNLMLKEGYKQSDIAKTMKVSNGRAYYLVKNARSIDLTKVQLYVTMLGDLDYKMKSGQVDSKTGFEFFLFGL